MALKIISFNANGLQRRVTLLGDLLAQTQADVVLVQETLLNARTRGNIIGYHHYKTPRGADSRGLSTYVRQGLSHALHLPPRTEHIDAQAVEVRLPSSSLLVVNAYRSPAEDNLLSTDVVALLETGPQVLAAGDLNCKHTSWNNDADNKAGSQLYSLSMRSDFHVVAPDTPTRTAPDTGRQTTLDIGLVKNLNCSVTAATLSCLGSDHAPVLFTVHTPPLLTPTTPRPDYNRARWPMFQRHIQDNFTICRFNTPEEVDVGVSTLTSTIQEALFLLFSGR